MAGRTIIGIIGDDRVINREQIRAHARRRARRPNFKAVQTRQSSLRAGHRLSAGRPHHRWEGSAGHGRALLRGKPHADHQDGHRLQGSRCPRAARWCVQTTNLALCLPGDG